jgi:hypothetical protein
MNRRGFSVAILLSPLLMIPHPSLLTLRHCLTPRVDRLD